MTDERLQAGTNRCPALWVGGSFPSPPQAHAPNCESRPSQAAASPCPHRLWGRGGCGWRLARAARSGAGLGFGNLRPEQSFLSGENGLFPPVPLVGEGLLVGPRDSQAVHRCRPGGGQVGRERNPGRRGFSTFSQGGCDHGRATRDRERALESCRGLEAGGPPVPSRAGSRQEHGVTADLLGPGPPF